LITLNRLREELIFEEKKNSVNDEKSLEFIFGFNLNNRDTDGLFIYSSNRLILISEPTRMQSLRKSEYRGLVGIVNVSHLVLEPTPNKQKFSNIAKLKILVDEMSDCMKQYYESFQTIDKKFWINNGHIIIDDSFHLPNDSHPYNRIRISSAGIYIAGADVSLNNK